MAVKKSRNFSGLVIYSHLKKTVHLQQVKWIQGRYTKRVPFLSKIVDKRVRDGTSGRSLPV